VRHVLCYVHDVCCGFVAVAPQALPPRDIRFVPLAQEREFDAVELMEFYETDPEVKHIKPYVPIIKDSPVYPVRAVADRSASR